MMMIYKCISLLINLLEGKDYRIDNTNYKKKLHSIIIETILIKHAFFRFLIESSRTL